MNLPRRRWLGHNVPDWVPFDQYVFFITICANARGSSGLIECGVAKGLIEAVKHRHQAGNWWAHLFLVMPDHVHGLISFPPLGAGMTKAVASWKRWTATTLKISWQRGFFDHRLRGDEGYEEKAHYVRMNPVRAGLVSDPEDWPHVWTPPR